MMSQFLHHWSIRFDAFAVFRWLAMGLSFLRPISSAKIFNLILINLITSSFNAVFAVEQIIKTFKFYIIVQEMIII